MPTYDYRCQACGHTFEIFQGMSDPVLRKCPECHRRKLERLIGGGAGLIFKGSGFYITDYRSDSYRQGAKQDAGNGSAAPAAKDGTTPSPAPAKRAKGKGAKRDGASS